MIPEPLARDGFLVPDGVYLAGNSLGLQPRSARAAIENVLAAWGSLAVEGWFEAGWLDHAGSLRAPLARIVGADPDEVVVMNTLTVNLHLLLAALYRPAGERQRIVIDADAFCSDEHAVSSHVAWHGLDPDEVVVRADLAVADDGAIDERTAVVLVAGVSYLTGARCDLGAITARAHAVGAVVIADLAHAAGNVPLALHADDVDAAAWCSYKYLNGGPGAPGGAYVHRRHHDRPRLAGWWGVDPAARFRMEPRFVPRAGAEGFALSTPSVLALAAAGAALVISDEIGMPVLRERSVALTAYLEELLDEVTARRPLRPLTPRASELRGCQLSYAVPDARLTAARLRAEHGVICDAREPDVIRLAPVPLWTSGPDCSAAAEALAAVLR